MSSDPWGDLATALLAVHEPFAHDFATHHGFLPGSPAALEVASEPYTDDWAAKPSRNANITGAHLANLAMDHLAGLAILLRTQSPVSVYGPSSVARSTIEIAARCYHLLEPGVSPLERIRRQQSDRLVALWERKRLVEIVRGESSAEAQEAIDHLDSQIKSVVDSARRHGLTPRNLKDNKRAPFIAGPEATKPVGATDLVEALVGQGNGLGAFSYQTMSAVGHGREHGIMQFFTHRGALLDHTHGDAFGTIEATPQQTAQNLAGVPIAVVGMLSRLYAHFGWPNGNAGPAANRLLLVWGRVAGIPIKA
ncbi:hypothetical protein [Streptomyces sp. NPDC048392]|uniref:hypothetical protein n=1 Tax=Streptomyces sp. NPDC048392 TaxID=3365543 RepID=UPI003713E2B1